MSRYTHCLLGFLRCGRLHDGPTASGHDGFSYGVGGHDGAGVPGLRSLSSLPISLHANWVWRLTESDASERYMQATRTVLLLFAVAPVWIFAAGISCSYRSWAPVGEHLMVLALMGAVFVELSLVRFRKVPFACSHLPGSRTCRRCSGRRCCFCCRFQEYLPCGSEGRCGCQGR